MEIHFKAEDVEIPENTFITILGETKELTQEKKEVIFNVEDIIEADVEIICRKEM